ncbi:MAG: LPXTG cell wall anchor domain-containing protein, partial [Clostridium sp.]|uniref:LPXTG cell wall anchor domain-containing protein n=1 Tax=Clostridium sp. TaxID=1506 RepID=UPI00290CC239
SVDKTALENKIKEAEAIDLSKYTDETVNVFKEKLNDAKAVRDDAKATQEAVNNALQSLNDSIAGLEEKPVEPSVDKTALENKIKEAEAIDLSKYTDETVNEFSEKLSIAKEVLANVASTQASKPSNPSGDNSDGETVKTGDTQGSKILLFGSLAVIAGIAGVYFRKKKIVE